MPPKGKKAATAKSPKVDKESKSEKKGKGSKKGSGEGNDSTPKVASRASKRNADKVAVSYKEVAENVDEKASEGSRPRPKPASKAKKTKVDSGSEVTDESSEEADSEAEKPKKKRSPPKKRPAHKKEAAPLADKKEGPADTKKENDVSDDEKDESAEEEEAPPAKKTKVEDSEADSKSKGKVKTDTDYEAIDFKSEKTTSDGKLWNKKISSWNVGGLKAWVKKGGLDFIKHEDPDYFCLQETRCAESKLPPAAKVDGYNAYWHCDAGGHGGVALYCKEKPIEVKYGIDKAEHDAEYRVITAEFDKFYLVNAYVPNSGRGLVTLPKRLKWDPDFRTYLKELDAKKPVILTGDLNVAHQAIDLTNPKTNAKTAGYTQEERDGMSELLKEGFVDSYRHLYPDKTGAYTFWTYMNQARTKNIGWRLDYFVISEKLVDTLCDNVMRSDVHGSDHCPITLLINV